MRLFKWSDRKEKTIMNTNETNSGIQDESVAVSREELDGITGGVTSDEKYCRKCLRYTKWKYKAGEGKIVCSKCENEYI